MKDSAVRGTSIALAAGSADRSGGGASSGAIALLFAATAIARWQGTAASRPNGHFENGRMGCGPMVMSLSPFAGLSPQLGLRACCARAAGVRCERKFLTVRPRGPTRGPVRTCRFAFAMSCGRRPLQAGCAVGGPSRRRTSRR
jgi:hypothetical protein